MFAQGSQRRHISAGQYPSMLSSPGQCPHRLGLLIVFSPGLVPISSTSTHKSAIKTERKIVCDRLRWSVSVWIKQMCSSEEKRNQTFYFFSTQIPNLPTHHPPTICLSIYLTKIQKKFILTNFPFHFSLKIPSFINVMHLVNFITFKYFSYMMCILT